MSLKQQTISSLGWSTISSIGKQVLQFVVVVILSRLLTPQDFGLLNMVTIFTGLALLFSEFGFGAALIQRDELLPEHLDSVFWLNILVGFGLMILLFLLAPLISVFYNEPRLIPLMRLVSVTFLIGSFGIVQQTLFYRNLSFRSLAVVEISSVVISGSIAIVMAYTGYGVWSLAWQMLLMTSVSVTFYWLLSAWRPRFILARRALKDLFQYSTNYLGAQVFNYAIRNSDNLIVGKFVGSEGLGIYGRAYSIMLLPVNQVINVAGRVMFPALSRVQKDISKVKAVYLKANRLIGLISIPIMSGLFIMAKPFVLAFFGNQWIEMILVLQILSLAGIRQTVGTTTGWIFQSQGRTDLQLRWAVILGVILIVSFLIGVHWGVVGVATAFAITNYLVWYWAIEIPGRLVGLTFWEYMANLMSVFLTSGAMVLIIWLISLILPNNLSPWFLLAVEVIAGGISYLVLLHIFKVRAYIEARELFSEQFKRFRTRKMPVSGAEQ